MQSTDHFHRRVGPNVPAQGGQDAEARAGSCHSRTLGRGERSIWPYNTGSGGETVKTQGSGEAKVGGEDPQALERNGGLREGLQTDVCNIYTVLCNPTCSCPRKKSTCTYPIN